MCSVCRCLCGGQRGISGALVSFLRCHLLSFWGRHGFLLAWSSSRLIFLASRNLPVCLHSSGLHVCGTSLNFLLEFWGCHLGLDAYKNFIDWVVSLTFIAKSSSYLSVKESSQQKCLTTKCPFRHILQVSVFMLIYSSLWILTFSLIRSHKNDC